MHSRCHVATWNYTGWLEPIINNYWFGSNKVHGLSKLRWKQLSDYCGKASSEANVIFQHQSATFWLECRLLGNHHPGVPRFKGERGPCTTTCRWTVSSKSGQLERRAYENKHLGSLQSISRKPERREKSQSPSLQEDSETCACQVLPFGVLRPHHMGTVAVAICVSYWWLSSVYNLWHDFLWRENVRHDGEGTARSFVCRRWWNPTWTTLGTHFVVRAKNRCVTWFDELLPNGLHSLCSVQCKSVFLISFCIFGAAVSGCPMQDISCFWPLVRGIWY